MCGAAIRIISLRLRTGVFAKTIYEVDSGGSEARGNIGFQIELRMAVTSIGEKAFILRIDLQKPFAKARVHLVARLSDRRTDRRRYSPAIGSQFFHSGDDRIGDAGERSAPTCMRGADDARAPVGQKDRRTIGSKNAEKNAGAVGNDRVGFRTFIFLRRTLGIDDGGSVHLPETCKLSSRQNALDYACAILPDRGKVIVSPEPALQTGHRTSRHPALPAEEAMRHIEEPGCDKGRSHVASISAARNSLTSPRSASGKINA